MSPSPMLLSDDHPDPNPVVAPNTRLRQAFEAINRAMFGRFLLGQAVLAAVDDAEPGILGRDATLFIMRSDKNEQDVQLSLSYTDVLPVEVRKARSAWSKRLTAIVNRILHGPTGMDLGTMNVLGYANGMVHAVKTQALGLPSLPDDEGVHLGHPLGLTRRWWRDFVGHAMWDGLEAGQRSLTFV